MDIITTKLNDYNIYLFHQGTNYQAYQMMGSHIVKSSFQDGVEFSLWAPNAKEVFVVGDFNFWDGRHHPMKKIANSGLWSTFIHSLKEGDLYKYEIHTQRGEVVLKSDPYAFCSELRPGSASKICDISNYKWQDEEWQKSKLEYTSYNKPLLIYEVHAGSWKRGCHGEFLSFRQLADILPAYLVEMGYTHVELMPVMEHPLDASWGYQITGYFAPTSRYGSPYDLMYFIDACHKKGIGVILDWVPSHFCKDIQGLAKFDGTPLYEYQDFRKAENIQWDTLNFDLGRAEVESFLISNVIYWLDIYHIDGIRIDAVANMLYLDYGKKHLQWSPNVYGGNENLEAVKFLRKINEVVLKYFPSTLMIAEESTTWPSVTGPISIGGLGFSYKWNMGWMNDVLKYMEVDSVYRRWHHNLLTFSFMYNFSENYILPLSHDEVVHCKKSLLGKMPGDYWQKFANLRTLYGYMMAHPGKKLLFMGGEFGQFSEWNENRQLDWNLLQYEMHSKLSYYVQSLNNLYKNEKSLWESDYIYHGFQWIDPNNQKQCILSFMRRANDLQDYVIIMINFTPKVYERFRIGVPEDKMYVEIFNSDDYGFGGSGQLNIGCIPSENSSLHNQPYSLEIKVPPLAVCFFKPVN